MSGFTCRCCCTIPCLCPELLLQLITLKPAVCAVAVAMLVLLMQLEPPDPGFESSGVRYC